MNHHLEDLLLSPRNMLHSNYFQRGQLFDLLPIAVSVFDADGVLVEYNVKAAELWGRKPIPANKVELFCGSFQLYTVDGTLVPHRVSPVAMCLKDSLPRKNVEMMIERPDSIKVLVQMDVSPIFGEGGVLLGVMNSFSELKYPAVSKNSDALAGAINMLFDTTNIKVSNHVIREGEEKFRQLSSSLKSLVEEKTIDLKRKNDELQRSEERYHKMVEEVEDYAIILLDREGLIENWNKGAEKIKGYKEEEIVGKSFSQFYLPTDREQGLPFRLLQQARETGKAIHEGWRLRKDGSQFWGSIVLTALHDDRNDVIGFSKVTRDLTERKIAEDKTREYSLELEFQNKELEQFAYAASHDLKEPLRKIHFYNYSIAENEKNHFDGKSREYLNRSINAVKRMTDLIEDLLIYSRTTSNVDSFQQVDLNEIVSEIALLHKEDFEQKKVVMETQILPVVWGVPFQFKQLMANLINNAIKYRNPERQLIIQITNDSILSGTEIKERDLEPGQLYYHISVRDNGIGFEAQYAEKIFEIFQRLSNHSGTKGSGIGLAICKKIVQNHRGVIKATGNVNAGAQFDIYIPTAYQSK